VPREGVEERREIHAGLGAAGRGRVGTRRGWEFPLRGPATARPKSRSYDGARGRASLPAVQAPSAEEVPRVIDDLLAGNAKFVTGEFRPNEDYYQAIATRQRPKVLWIGCSDSRVSEHQMTGSKPGTMFVHRNVANIVAFNDVNISAILEYGVVHLKIEDIIVCGHTRCGGIAAIEDGVHENYIADWLCIATGAKEAANRIAKERKLSREEKLAVLTEENVRLQIKHLKNLALIRNMHAKGSLPRIHGWLYRVETGAIDILVDGREPVRKRPVAKAKKRRSPPSR
jgi:carbonic anhydrase